MNINIINYYRGSLTVGHYIKVSCDQIVGGSWIHTYLNIFIFK